MRRAACSADRAENSRNAQPLDLVAAAPGRVSLGVSRRTIGGGSVVSGMNMCPFVRGVLWIVSESVAQYP